ncbi:carbamoyl-phosphate synthase L chain, ATP binding domain-containing protein [Glomus cerebriforme]|uniref:Carbamoyl-phosphate synthase L chain, ATP binding domain-containing protein n=1 Tax=Glomus cerebriforme TaxID=658196 RepID=A0A397T1B9_9GLOM|nr:carbamoyl-phosphate synthase L chain, ATP binding domain-containing protein [Glomus cerebriforme]
MERKTFDKILIANRGEIAVRVIKTAKKMGIKTVAIYSDADARSLHVILADEAVRVGPPPTNQSYLSVPAILNAIEETGAEAVHPGYGFLSENSHFVKSLDEAGVTFIGPGEKAMADLGDKIQSKIIAKNSGVNTIPGFDGVVKNTDHALEISHSIGYPVMIKASAGGGGKGMRIAWNDQEVIEGFKLASQESKSSFGDDRLLIEKYIDNPRHIEIQILADKFGNALYLPERECSIQRRNQKVIEEAPSVHLDPSTRKAMGEQAVSLVKHVGYVSAGTVEFLVDPERNFYFLEMNTRLQVEHPITEYITGIDLVEQMIRIAADQKLSMKQDDIKFKGWAVESRVYAEDPEKYLPSIGRLSKYIEPVSLTDKHEVRCDSGIVEGSEISIYYDPLICKLSTYGETRSEAIQNMERALDSYVIKGVTHNIPLLREVIGSSRFKSGKISTKFLAEEYPGGFKGHALKDESLFELASVASLVHAKRDVRNWCWRDNGEALSEKELNRNAPKNWNLWIKVHNNNGNVEIINVLVERRSTVLQHKDEYQVKVANHPPTIVNAQWPLESPLINAQLRIPNQSERFVTAQYLDPLPVGFRLQYMGTKFDITIHNQRQHELSHYMIEKPKKDLSKVILSPMPGSVVSIAVNVGDIVNEGVEVAVVEAMKMQNVLRASRVGKVKKINVKPGSSVAADEVMIEFEDEKDEKPFD